MKAKKSKNLSVQISLYSVFDELSDIDYLQQFKDHPDFLAAQIDDLNTLLHFASSNYTQKARSILNLSKQFTKSIEAAVQSVNQIETKIHQMPQFSYPQMAYETLKRGTSLQLQEDGNQESDWRAVQTEFQLKFLESKNLDSQMQWEKCYNSQERCIQISKISNSKSVINGHTLQKQQQNNSLKIDLTLKIEGSTIVWDIKKVTYQNNCHYSLLTFYKEDLIQWVREQHPQSIHESDKYVLSLIHKSLDYIDVILLFIQLKRLPFNQNIQESDRKNGILNLFDPNQIRSPSHPKSKNIKVCFILPFSIVPPSIILRVDGLNVLKIQFTTDNQIQLKIKLKNKKQQMTLKKLTGSIKKTNFSLQNLIDVAQELLDCLKTFENFVEEKVQQFKLDVFLSNRSTNLILYFKNINATLIEEDISENEKINQQILYELAQGNITFSGLYLVFNSQSFPLMPPMVTFVNSQPEILIKSSKTLSGFVNRILKKHPLMTFQEVMYHLHFFELIEQAQQKSNWSIKLVYCDIYLDGPIIYKFKLLTQKKVGAQNFILKKDQKQDHLSSIKDYSIYIKISENFKTVNFIYVTPIAASSQNTRSDPSMSGSKNDSVNRAFYKPAENEIPDKYFKDSWRDYMKKRNDSQVLKNEYLDPSLILKAAHYVLNHLQFNRYIKGRSGIFKSQQMVNLMDE